MLKGLRIKFCAQGLQSLETTVLGHEKSGAQV